MRISFFERIPLIWYKAVLFILVLLVMHNRWVVPRISNDQMRQMVAVENILRGNGISFQLLGSQSTEIKMDNSFPMGYYALMLPFALVVDDILLLHRLLELVGILLCIIQLYLLSRFLSTLLSSKVAVYLIVIFSLIQLNPWRASGFTDIWSLALFLWAMRLVIVNTHFKVGNLIAIGLLAFSTIFIRYAYYPLAFIPVVAIFLKLPLNRFKSYIPILVLPLCLVLVKLFDQLYFSGYDHLAGRTESGTWFFDHLSQMEPLGFNALYSDHVIFGALGLDRWGVNTNWSLKYFILGLSLAILMFLAIFSFRGMIKIGLRAKFDEFQVFSNCVWITIVFNLGFITLLSVYYPTKADGYIYTWSLISRYFAPAYVLFHILLISIYFQNQSGKSMGRKMLATMIVTSFIFQTTYFGSFFFRHSLNGTWQNYVEFYDRPEMPKVISNYYLLRQDANFSFKLDDNQKAYDYLSLYYLSGNQKFLEEVERDCPECFH